MEATNRPTTTPKGSDERIAIYAARYKEIRDSGARMDDDFQNDIPSLFHEEDDNDSPAAQKPGSRETYSTEPSQKERGVLKKCPSSVDIFEEEVIYPHPH